MAVELADNIYAAKPLLVDQAILTIQGVIDTERGRFKLQSGQFPKETPSKQTGLLLTDAGSITPEDTIWLITDKEEGSDYLLMTDVDIYHMVIVRKLNLYPPQAQLAGLTGLGRERTLGGVEYLFNPSTGSSFVYTYGEINPFLQKIVDRIRE